MVLELTRSRINRRTRGKTWDIIPGSEKDGYVRIWVNYRGRIHHKRWVRIDDLSDTRSGHIALFQPVTLSIPEQAVPT